MVTVKTLAPAKVNLHLDVGAKRDDGFHDLLSLFQMVDLADEVEVSITESDTLAIAVDTIGMELPHPNTMSVAVDLFAKRAGIIASIAIRCRKRIPQEAGLGGGSSDAAAVLKLLNDCFGNPLSPCELSGVGALVGSDVPFFLGESPVACVEGRGEKITPLAPREDLEGLVVMPNSKGVSTAKAYAALDKIGRTENPLCPSLDREEMISMYGKPLSFWSFSNSFRSVMGTLSDLYDRLDRVAQGYPGCFGGLSGSGAAYCYLWEREQEFTTLRTKLEDLDLNVTIFDIKCLHPGHSGATVLV